ncbi:MAG: ThiF family adenylyltransferase [Bdellovibrio sp.]
MSDQQFVYEKAFSRNIGWFRPEDQQVLRNKRIAIPGMGGVGGHHLHNFLRLGISKFNIADPDIFEVQNFNRQFAATCNSIKRSKIDVLKEAALAINPECDLRCFPQGVQPDNMEEFLKDVDVVVDALDLYAMDIRIPLYELAHKKGIPVVTAGPFGMGTSIMAFNPAGMSFGEYFDLKRERLTVEAQIIRFLAGMTPHLIHRSYLRYPDAVDIFERRLPSLNIGCFAAGAAMGAMVIEILLDKNNPRIRWAPRGFQVDFNKQKSFRFYRPWGNKNPLQKAKIKIFHKFFQKKEFLPE